MDPGSLHWIQLARAPTPPPPTPCLKDFEKMFLPDSSHECDIMFHSYGTDISLYSMLERIVFNQQKIDDIWAYMIINLLDRQLPSDISMTIVKYLN